jgi:ABC-type uncharacterized transport system substrate-binding protein
MRHIATFTALLLLFVLAFPPMGKAQDHAGKKILVVHSYDQSFAWTADIDAALQRMFAKHKITVRTIFLDANIHRDEAELAAAGQAAAEEMRKFEPDVVVTSDDDAQRYFAAQFAGNSSAPAFVFCGVNQNPAQYGYPALNVTGVVEKLAWSESIALLRRMRPDIRRIIVVLDARPSSQAAATQMRLSTPGDIEAEWVIVDTFDKWRQIILSSGTDHDAIAIQTYHNLPDAGGKPVPDSEVMRWTAENTPIPSLAFFDYTVADGALCGVIQTGFEHGTLAAGMALRILEGALPANIPIVEKTQGLTMLNLKTARKLRISIPDALIEEAAALVE